MTHLDELLVGLQREKTDTDAERAAAAGRGEDLAPYDAHLVQIQVAVSQMTNLASLTQAALSAIADLNTAEAMISSSGWDGLTPAQRKATALGLVRQNRAKIRLILGLLDSPS